MKSAYYMLLGRCPDLCSMSNQQEMAFKYMWKSAAPLKVIAFSWELLLDRLPTRSNIFCRKVIEQ